MSQISAFYFQGWPEVLDNCHPPEELEMHLKDTML